MKFLNEGISPVLNLNAVGYGQQGLPYPQGLLLPYPLLQIHPEICGNAFFSCCLRTPRKSDLQEEIPFRGGEGVELCFGTGLI